jgi:hypothetical protein
LLSFYFLCHSIAKIFLLKNFQVKISYFLFVLIWDRFSEKTLTVKKYLFSIHIDKKNYLAQKAENVISVSRTHAGQNEKTVCKIFIGS